MTTTTPTKRRRDEKRGKQRSHGDGGLYYVPSRKLWRATIELGRDIEGKRMTKVVTSRTQRGAIEKRDKIREEIREHGALLTKTATLSEWGTRYLEEVTRYKNSPNTYSNYASVLNNWILPTLGQKKLTQLTAGDVRHMLDVMRKEGMSGSSRRTAYQYLAQILKAAVAERLVRENVCQAVDLPSNKATGKGNVKKKFSGVEAKKILSTANKLAVSERSRWWAAFTTGMRQSELLGLRWQDVDLDAGVARVSWQLQPIARDHGCQKGGEITCGKNLGASCPQAVWRVPDGFEFEQLVGGLCVQRPKGGDARYVPLIPPVVKALREWRRESIGQKNPHGLVWPAPNGRPRNKNEDVVAFRQLLHDAGLIPKAQVTTGANAGPGTHAARHTVATLLMELGIPEKVITAIIGHTDVEVTREHYLHVSPETVHDAMSQLGSSLGVA